MPFRSLGIVTSETPSVASVPVTVWVICMGAPPPGGVTVRVILSPSKVPVGNVTWVWIPSAISCALTPFSASGMTITGAT